MQPWEQNYDPAGSLFVSAAIAVIPIAFFFIGLAILRWRAHTVAGCSLLIILLEATLWYGMPAVMALSAAFYGFILGMLPIAWIVVTALFLYKIVVKSGKFEIIRDSITAITKDQRLQALLIGFSFGAFLEGAAGFGAPVAITGALLAGLGFNPLYAATLCLIANTAPVAFGALGVPILVAGQVSGLDPHLVGAMVGRQLPILSLLVPFWLIFVMDGWKGIRETWPATLIAGGSFAVSQFFTSNFIGPELPDIISSIISLVSVAIFLHFWAPSSTFSYSEKEVVKTPSIEIESHTFSKILYAWSPFLVLTLMVTLWSLPSFKAIFDPKKDGILASTVLSFTIPYLDGLVTTAQPIAKNATSIKAIFSIPFLSATGTAILISALISALMLRIKPKQVLETASDTLYILALPVITIGCVLSFAHVANFSGLSSTLALALAHTGEAFPVFSPILGWLGVFLTGSDTSSNALFCGLQANTAQQIGVSDLLMVATNSSGGVTGKMISPQSIAVACAAVGMIGKESALFRSTLKHSLLLVGVIAVISVLQAYPLSWMIPK